VRSSQDGSYDLSAPPPFTLQDLRNAIPAHCWEKNTARSMAFLALDVAIVAGLAVGAYTLNAW
jgi:omega-3 fatty acid desaturase (delta-15 desaturase)